MRLAAVTANGIKRGKVVAWRPKCAFAHTAYMERSSKAYGYTKEKLCGVVKFPTAIHNIKSNKGSKTAGVKKEKMDK